MLQEQGYCLWKCAALGGAKIMIVDQAPPEGSPAGYPVWTLRELELADSLALSTMRLIGVAKRLSNAVVTSVDKRRKE
jgi:hypothetical protein